MSEPDPKKSFQAAERFSRARRKVFFEDLLRLVRGASPELLSFEAVQAALNARQQLERREPEIIPLDKIVGSVGRYRDFTREFLPRESVDENRWKKVDILVHSPTGLPPIEVYQVGDAYFVRDGHHRVSVARANDFNDIEAYVTVIDTQVPITATTRPEDLVLKAAYADFLQRTRLKDVRPQADVEATEVGAYDDLLKHIEVHRYYLGLELQREISSDEAVASWYDRVYLPVAEAIWQSDFDEQFPNRTAADLYLWVCRHREELAAERGVMPAPQAAVADLAGAEVKPPKKVVKTVKQALGVKPKSQEAPDRDASVDPAKRNSRPSGKS